MYNKIGDSSAFMEIPDIFGSVFPAAIIRTFHINVTDYQTHQLFDSISESRAALEVKRAPVLRDLLTLW